MMKLLVFVALVLAVVYFFRWIRRRPPGDWRRGGESDPGPVTPAGMIDHDTERKPGHDPGSKQSGKTPETVSADSGGDGGGGGD